MALVQTWLLSKHGSTSNNEIVWMMTSYFDRRNSSNWDIGVVETTVADALRLKQVTEF